MRAHVIVTIVAMLCVTLSHAENDETGAERRELSAADKTLLLHIVVAASTQGRYRCSQNSLCCLGGDAGELATALIAARDTQASRSALARLLRFNLDADYGEAFDCYVVSKGEPMREALSRVDPDVLRRDCEAQVSRLMKLHGQDLGTVGVDRVCRPAAAIRTHLHELLEALDSHRSCPF